MANRRKEPDRKLFGVRMDRALMVQLQHLATDEDKYVMSFWKKRRGICWRSTGRRQNRWLSAL